MIKVRDYICAECGHQFEKFVTYDSELVECPKCGSGKTTQSLSASSFKVTGQGAYTNNMKV